VRDEPEDEIFRRAYGGAYRFALHPAQEPEGVQEAQEEPAPAITPSLPTAAKREIFRRALRAWQRGQAMGASASRIGRSASNSSPQSVQTYS